MLGAVFFLAVNFVVAISFSAVFAVVSTRSRSRRAALWFAAGFGVASLSALCELAVAFLPAPKFFALGAFATVLSGMMLLRVGLGEMYGFRMKWLHAAIFLLVSIGLSIAIYDLPRGTPVQAFSYQAHLPGSRSSVPLRFSRRCGGWRSIGRSASSCWSRGCTSSSRPASQSLLARVMWPRIMSAPIMR